MEREARNAKRGTRNAEHETRNAKRETRNAEHGTRNAEHGTRNAEHSNLPELSLVFFTVIINFIRVNSIDPVLKIIIKG